MGLREEASWEDRVHILHALLRLLPEVSRDLCSRLHGILLYLLNLDQPPSLQVCPSPPHVAPAPPRPAPPHPALSWASSTSLAACLCSGQDTEAVCDAGAAAGPGLLPGFP